MDFVFCAAVNKSAILRDGSVNKNLKKNRYGEC
jgi:hypothetical protein